MPRDINIFSLAEEGRLDAEQQKNLQDAYPVMNMLPLLLSVQRPFPFLLVTAPYFSFSTSFTSLCHPSPTIHFSVGLLTYD